MSKLISAPVDVRINLLPRPFGLRRGALSFSWVTGTDCARQSAYRIRIYEGIDATLEDRPAFDSGKVASSFGSGVTPVGAEACISLDRLCYARVTVWDEDDRASAPSAPLPFTVGTEWLSTDALWAAPDADGKVDDFLFARHVFTLTAAEIAKTDRALMAVTAASPEPTRQFVYTLYVNGENVGVGPVRYGRTADGEEVLYTQTYDVTSLLRVGENVVASLLYALSERGFLCQLSLYGRDSTAHRTLSSARDMAAWRVLRGDAVFGKSNSIGTSYFTAHACNVDARIFPFGFTEPGFDDRNASDGWEIPVSVGAVGGGRRLLSAACEPVRRMDAPREGVRVERLSNGHLLIDLGAEIVGGLRLSVDLPVACTVELGYGEQRTPTGCKSRMNTGNHYREVWQLAAGRYCAETFSLMTFRYVEIAGYPGELTPDDVCGVEIRKAFDHTHSVLHTTHPLLADLHRLVKHTVRVTSQDLYVDSQSRERGAYEGDLLINMLAAYAMENSPTSARLTVEYLLGHRTWPADYRLMMIFAARADFMVTGNTAILFEWYDTLKGCLFTDHIDPICGLVRSPVIGMSVQDAVLVDWPPSERDGYDMSLPVSTVFNALNLRALDDMAAIADATGHTADAVECAARADALRTAMTEHLYAPAVGRFCDGLGEDGTPSSHFSQHATAFALDCGAYTDTAMADRLAESLAADGRIRMSVYGAFFLLEGLYRSGHGAVANRLLLDEDISEGARTWAYMMDVLGATVTTEAWCERNKPNMTLSHPWGAAPAYMLTSGILGIRPTSPAYATFEVRPCMEGVGNIDLTVPTVRGRIRVACSSEGGTACLTVEVPGNTVATVHLPDGTVEEMGAGTHTRRCIVG